MRTDSGAVIEKPTGPVRPSAPFTAEREGAVERCYEIEAVRGRLPPAWPYADPVSAQLGSAVRWWMRHRKNRIGMEQSGQPEELIEAAASLEGRYGRRVGKLLRAHVLWPWLEPLKGLRGPYTAYLISRIRDPRRFPGQRCERGHYLPAIYEPGTPCPHPTETDDASQSAEVEHEIEDLPGTCGASLGPERQGTGVRAIWHYFGLHVVDGRLPRKKKGQKCTWLPEARAFVLGPQGIADQIVRHRPDPYRGIYDQNKERLTVTRSWAQIEITGGESERVAEIETDLGPPPTTNGTGAEAAPSHEIDGRVVPRPRALPAWLEHGPLTPGGVESRARTIAAKAFVGDLLTSWKDAISPGWRNG